MASNVLPLFWHLASSSRDTRVAAGADLVAAAETFQAAYKPKANGGDTGRNNAGDDDDDDDDDEEEEDDDDDDDDDDEEDDEMDVDGGSKRGSSSAARTLDAALARDNAPDVVYCVKRLVRGLASSRDSSRLGFAVALTELLARTPSVTAAEVLSLLERASPWSSGKGAEERDAMFARLFGVVAVADSGALFASSSTATDFDAVADSLLALGNAKAWLAEAAGWALLRAVRGLLAVKDVSWRAAAVDALVDKVYAEDKSWTPEKVALTVALQASPRAGKHDWKALTAPTFRTAPLLSQPNLVALGRVLKEGGDGASAGGAYTPKLHYVWDVILDAYFDREEGVPPPPAPFADVFRVVVDEALFANTSSAERKYWGFQVFTRALPLLPADEVPLLFTPNFMRCWMNNLGSADRHLHKAARAAALAVQEHVRAHPAAGFPLLAQLVGRHGRPDFDRVTRTRTVETITASLTPDGVGKYVEYLEGVLLGRDSDNSADASAVEERRSWALDQMASLCRNGAVPKTDTWVKRVLDDLLVTGFFLVRRADKKSAIAVLRAVPKPPLTETTEAAARARFFSALVDVTAAAATASKGGDKGDTSAAEDVGGADKWLAHALDMVRDLEADPHTELATDADDEIKAVRKRALATLATLRGKNDADATMRGARLLISFLLLQTYDDAEDALDMLDEVVGAVQALYPDKKAKRKSQGGDGDDAPPPIDALLDVLIALLDKGSADLRTLANLVFGMLAPAMTASSVEHLVAQLEQSGAGAEEDDDEGEEEDDEDGDGDDDEDEEEEEEEDDEDGDDDDGSDSESDSDSSADSDANAEVDPEFRRRVAEALKVSGALDESEGGDGSDADSDSDESVWDDDQMMKVDEQLAAVFKQHANNKAKKSLKHAAIESVHFKNRVLDFIDAFLRRPSALAVELVMPLLRVVRGGGELGNKAAGIVRARLGKASGASTTSGEDASIDAARAAAVLAEVHALARHAPSAEFSALCSAASLFAARLAPEPALATYAATLDDFMQRKHSAVQPAFIAEYVRRYPARAWALTDALARRDAGANAFRQVRAYTILAQLLAHAPALVKAGDLTRPDAEDVLARAMTGVYDTFERAANADDASGAGWKADRLKELGKFALTVARTARTIATDAGADPAAVAAQVCDAPRLAAVTAAVKDGRTRDMKGVHALLTQLAAVIAAKPKQAKTLKAPKANETGKTGAKRKAPAPPRGEKHKVVKAKKTKA